MLIEITGSLAEARGRNGWFRPRECFVERMSDGLVWLEIASSQRGKMAPIHMKLEPHDADKLAEAILEQVPYDDRLEPAQTWSQWWIAHPWHVTGTPESGNVPPDCDCGWCYKGRIRRV